MCIDGTYYREDSIGSLHTNLSLMKGDYTLGNVIIGSFSSLIYGLAEGDVVRYSVVDVFCRLKDNEGNVTNWLPKGKYLVSDVLYDPEMGVTQISGYDYLCQAEGVPYPPGDSSVSTWTGETMRSVATRMATYIGIPLEDENQVSQEDYAAPPYGFTAREILGDIALMDYGCWFLTYINSGDETSPVASPKLRLWKTTSTGELTALGREPLSFDKLQDPEPIGKVSIIYGYDANGVQLVKEAIGTGTTEIEYEVETITDGNVIQIMANNLVANYYPSTYEPFTATGVELDPACELGDPVSCNGSTSIIGALDTEFSVGMFASISSATIPTIEEFKYKPKSVRSAERVKRTTLTNSAKIEVNSNEILAEVTRATSAEENLNTNIRSTLTQTADEIRATITTIETDLENHAVEQSKYIKYGDGKLEMGTEGSQTKAVLTDTKLGFIDPTGDEKAYIGQDPIDGVYKFFVINGHIVNKLELGDHWDLVASGSDNENRLTIRWRN